MIKKLFILLPFYLVPFALYLLPFCLYSQTQLEKEVAAIKANHNFLWGEASSKTLEEADKYAIAFLIGQISTTVESEFKMLTDQETQGNTITFKEKVEAVVKTYSQATLNNLERIVLSEEPNAKVFRYLHKNEIEKIWESRKEKIENYIQLGEKAEKNLKISDALQYYYWGLLLTNSLPSGNNLKHFDNEINKDVIVSIWLKDKISTILSDITVEPKTVQKKENFLIQNLEIMYQKQPVSNLTFSYFNTRNWVDFNVAKDGRAAIDIPAIQSQIKIKVEYQFKGEAQKMDSELKSVMETMSQIPFPKANIESLFQKENAIVQEITAGALSLQKTKEILPTTTPNNSAKIKTYEVIEPQRYINIMVEIENAIKTKNYLTVEQHFTKEGFVIFNELINYGNATIISQPKYILIKNDNVVICRSMPLQFKFKNNKTFVEDVVFRFNEELKISSLAFTLSQNAEKEILGKDKWNETSRLTIVDFLENYQTAYALKRADYLESIFSEEALIIVGTMLQKSPPIENAPVLKDKNAVKYTTYTKEQFINKLRISFASKEYINIHFSDNEILKAGNEEIYGIQIHQQYSSNNYGDQGYLFLLVDLRRDTPIIHVRAWQPDRDPDFGYFDLGKFKF